MLQGPCYLFAERSHSNKNKDLFHWSSMTRVVLQVSLQAESVDIAVFCLSLMGTNLGDFLAEAHRVLKKGWVKLSSLELVCDTIRKDRLLLKSRSTYVCTFNLLDQVTNWQAHFICAPQREPARRRSCESFHQCEEIPSEIGADGLYPSQSGTNLRLSVFCRCPVFPIVTFWRCVLCTAQQDSHSVLQDPQNKMFLWFELKKTGDLKDKLPEFDLAPCFYKKR